MGKKAKKKSRPPPVVKRMNSPAKKDVPCLENPNNGVVEAITVQNGTVNCTHIEKGFDLNAVSAKIGSSDPVQCEDCRDDYAGKKGGRGKAKHVKKKGGGSTAIWVCLQCGHYSCGGVAFPTNAQCHATKHARDTRHPVVIQFEKQNLRWCFRCRAPIPMEKGKESQENEDVFGEVVKLIRLRAGQSTDASADVEDVWFGSASVTSEVKSCNYEVTSMKNGGGHVVRGLVNLGNTCFFNSVMQNLLAIGSLRDYLSKLCTSMGPLTASLKKLFSEVHGESGTRNGVNPKGLFGNICVKAPQFKGSQQHDSHELLRCLLDGLSTEDFNMKKRVNSDQECQSSPGKNSTFVDAIFGGQISSTVCCVECGHSSTVYEPFLDLSLPVPTKKPPPKTFVLVSRAKKGKAIPKRGGKVRARISREPERAATSAEAEASSGGFRPQNSFSSAGDDEGRLLSQDSSSAIREDERVNSMRTGTEQVDAYLDENTWLDYNNAETKQDDRGFVSSDNHSNVVCAETIDHLSKEGDSGLQDLSTAEPDIGEIAEQEVAPLNNSTRLDYTVEPAIGQILEQEVVPLDGSTWLDYTADPDIGEIAEHEVAPLDNSTRLDYLGDEPMEDEICYSWQDDRGFVSSDNHSNVIHAETMDHLSKEGDSGLQGSSTAEPDIGEIAEQEVAPLNNSTRLDYTVEPAIGQILEQEVVPLDSSTWLDYTADPDTGEVAEHEVAPLDNSTWLDYLGDEPMEDEICYSWQENGVGFVQNYWLTDYGFMQETSKDVDQVSRNSWEDEPPLPVVGSEVLLLPYNDEISAMGSILKEEGEASSTGCRQDEPEFDGFGDLFEEPDVIYGPLPNPNSNDGNTCNNDNADSTFMGENSSGSDAGEVDNSDSPVSVESCLAYFTKQELLSNDNAWHCEKCSENLRRETKKKKLKEVKGRSIAYRNEETSCSASGDNTSNGCSPSPHGEDAFFQNGKIHHVFQNHEDSKDEDALPDHPKGSSKTVVGNHHAIGASDGMIGRSGQFESDELEGKSVTKFVDDDDEADSKNVKVKRDATKRVLIYKAPPVLTVHLKRFRQDARGRLSKLSGHVNFREVIDLKPYLDPRVKDCEKYVYRLVGVVEHSGVMRGGHYVAYVRGGGCEKADNGSVWYYASDTLIREATLEEVLLSDAYILFYELV